MNGKKKYNFNHYLNNAQKEVKEFVLERGNLNSKLKNFIINFQNIDSKIYNSLFEARDFYIEKRINYNIKIEKLKREKIEYSHLWNSLNNKLKTLQKPELNSNLLVSIEYARRSLEDINEKIYYLSNRLEEQILDIAEENEIIEKLSELESNKQNRIKILSELEHKHVTRFQSSNYYLTKNKKETLEKELQEIYEKLNKFINKRLMTHKKILELYRKVREFEIIKKQVNNELVDYKTEADEYHMLFLKLMNVNKRVLFEEFSDKEISKVRPRKIPKSAVKAIINKKRKLKKLEQKKLAIALKKQKLGKKLDFYELQLILKHSKS